jgi:hypothetical protein
VTTYRERLTAPVSWWIAALGFAAVWGWVFLVATTWLIAGVVTALLAAAGFYAVWRYGSVVIEADADGLRVGRAFVERRHVGEVRALDRASYRTQLGTGADARAYLVTRPYLDHGVLVAIDDPADPAPYWLVSSRHPDAFATALAAPPVGAASDTNEEAPRGQAS